MVEKILIADDDLEIADLLRFTFEQEKYTVIVANDGEEALRLVKEEKPDIVILDVNMPKMTGFEVTERIRQDSSTCLIPVIMLTSLSRAKDKLTGIKLGADDYLNKPFEPFELVSRVENIIRRSKATLSANPLTQLPGNILIENEIKERLEKGHPFAVVYTDIDYFKSFNDKYGFEKGDGVIKLTSTLLRAAVQAVGNENDFLGHIGGEDFVIVTTPDRSEPLAKLIIKYFDDMAPQQYDEDVRRRGYLWGLDRQGQEMRFSLMSVSLGIVSVTAGKFRHYSQIVEQAKNMLKKAKLVQGSAFVQD